MMLLVLMKLVEVIVQEHVVKLVKADVILHVPIIVLVAQELVPFSVVETVIIVVLDHVQQVVRVNVVLVHVQM